MTVGKVQVLNEQMVAVEGVMVAVKKELQVEVKRLVI